MIACNPISCAGRKSVGFCRYMSDLKGPETSVRSGFIEFVYLFKTVQKQLKPVLDTDLSIALACVPPPFLQAKIISWLAQNIIIVPWIPFFSLWNCIAGCLCETNWSGMDFICRKRLEPIMVIALVLCIVTCML